MKVIKRVLILVCLIVSAAPVLHGTKLKYGLRVMVRSSVLSADTARINKFIRKGFMSLEERNGMLPDPEVTAAYIDSATMLCERSRTDLPPVLYLLRAEYKYEKGDFCISKEEAMVAEKKSAEAGEYDVQARALLFLGKCYHRTGYLQESIDHYRKAVQLAEKAGLKGVATRGYHGMMTVYKTIGDFSEYRQSLRLMTEAGIAEDDPGFEGEGYYHLGTSFCGDSASFPGRDFGKADSLLMLAYKLAKRENDSSAASLSLLNAGWNFYLEKMYDSSLYYYHRSLTYSLPAKLFSHASNSLGNIGTIYRDLNDYETAIEHYQKAIDQARQVNDFFDLQWIYMDMSNIYLKSGDTVKAYTAYVRFKEYSDEWIKSEANRDITDARIRYEADTHNKELALLSLRLKNNRILNIGFAGLVFLGLIIGWLIFRSIKLGNKHRMSEMNHKISELTQANLRQQMNPHFIFNTLNSIQYYMYRHDKLETNTYLTKFSCLMRKILDNSGKTYIPLRDELEALTLYLDLEKLRFKNKFSYQINVDEEIDPLLYRIPAMLIQPYVENSICHGLMPAENFGLVTIDMKLDKDHITCIVQDNGIGRKAAQKIRKMKNDSHDSLGTRIVSSRLDLINSLYGTSLHTTFTDLKNDRGQSEGTRVEIEIPIMV